MATATTPAPSRASMTAEAFAKRSDPGHPEELVEGRVVPMPMPNRRHGQICNKAGRIFGNYAEEHDLGHVLSNDAGVITRRDPDTVRGADVAFYSFGRLPRGPLPAGYGPEAPELVIEVKSPGDRWPGLLAKAAEYLAAGTLVVVVLDDERRSAHVLGADGTTRMLGPEEQLRLPGVLGEGFVVPVGHFFE